MTAISLPTARAPRRLRLTVPRLASVRPALPAERLQTRLVAHGALAPAAVSRRLDRATIDAVRSFQRRRGLRVDGIPGPATCDALLMPVAAAQRGALTAA